MRTEKSRKTGSVRLVIQQERMRGYRQRMRAAGMRQISLWVPDARSPQVREEARRQAFLASAAPEDAETLAFIEAVADTSGWT